MTVPRIAHSPPHFIGQIVTETLSEMDVARRRRGAPRKDHATSTRLSWDDVATPYCPSFTGYRKDATGVRGQMDSTHSPPPTKKEEAIEPTIMQWPKNLGWFDHPRPCVSVVDHDAQGTSAKFE